MTRRPFITIILPHHLHRPDHRDHHTTDMAVITKMAIITVITTLAMPLPRNRVGPNAPSGRSGRRGRTMTMTNMTADITNRAAITIMAATTTMITIAAQMKITAGGEPVV